MAFFSKPKTEVERLQTKSSNILDVFTKTVNELKSVNDEIQTSREETISRISQLELDLSSLNETRVKNESVILKIEKILE